MTMSEERVLTQIGDRTLSLSNLTKVLYPATGTTKAEVIDYYHQISPVLIDHIGDRGITLRRWPDGVEAESFFEKRCPSHRPDWVGTCLGPGDRREGIQYCRFDDPASLVWSANLAALELHSPMARCTDIDSPTMVVFDLDPGEPATIIECCAVALDIGEVLDALGLEAFAKTSGSKGLQLYLPLNTPHTHDGASSFALAVAQLLEKQHPERVTSQMAKKLRPRKVLIDWSQNSRHKTTIAPYSMRGRSHPTVSTPLTWDEVEQGAAGEPLSFEFDDVLDRVDELGDPFAPTLTLEQELPSPTR
ncbi:MAG: hypothetical protein GY929_18835 [Actinomycetia bacterium]|nr:hypothetical protein [Actinomycetes bacterium]